MKAVYKISIRIINCPETFTDKHTGEKMPPGVIASQEYAWEIKDEKDLATWPFVSGRMGAGYELRDQCIEIVTERVDDGS